MGKKKTINGDVRTLILHVMNYFEEEKKKGMFVVPVEQVLKRTCAATGVSLSTLTRIKKEEKNILQQLQSNDGQEQTTADTVKRKIVKLPTPGKKRRSHFKVHIDDAMVSSIRNVIYSFYERNEVPTLNKILAMAKTEFNFPGQKETLRKIMVEKLGYTFNKKNSKKEEQSVEKPNTYSSMESSISDNRQY